MSRSCSRAVSGARATSTRSRGQWGARDFDKVAFSLPIPRFDPGVALHADIAAASSHAETVAAAVKIDDGAPFQRARGMVRTALADDGIASKIDGLVGRLVDI